MVSSALTHQTDSVLETLIPCPTFKLDWAALLVIFTLDFSDFPLEALNSTNVSETGRGRENARCVRQASRTTVMTSF